jgi:hypothetical protein
VAGAVYANRIARWNRTQWTPLGDGLNAAGKALVVHEGEVVVAGEFTAAGTTISNGIASWDGANWAAFGPGTPDGGILSLAVHGGQLIAAGRFEEIGLEQIPYLAVWDGFAWGPLGAPQIGAVEEMITIDDSLFVYAGRPAEPGGLYDEVEIRRWDGVSWMNLLSETELGTAAFTIWQGDFTVFVAVDHMFALGARWTGLDWDLIRGPGIDDDIRAMAVYQGDLIVGGSFEQVGSIGAAAIARWNGATWSPLGAGIDGEVFALYADGADLYVGGSFAQAGGVPASAAARWDGANWHALGSGLTGDSPRVNAIEKHDGEMIFGGSFEAAGGVAAHDIARWNGATWDSVGSVTEFYGVFSLLSTPGGLVAGTAHYDSPVFLWDGGSWLDLGFYTADFFQSAIVHAITVFEDEFGWVNLGGSFDGGSCDSETPVVNSLVIHDGELVAGGGFGLDGVSGEVNIASWDGMSWSPIGGGVSESETCGSDGGIHCLAGWGPRLAVGGDFGLAGEAVSHHLAVWDCSPLTGIGGTDPAAVVSGLLPGIPNPFVDATSIRFRITETAPVDLVVYDVQGRRVRALRSKEKHAAGLHVVSWHGRDDSGRIVSPGVYFVRLRAGETTEIRKVTRLR